MGIAERLLKEIEDCKKTVSVIAAESGVPQPTLFRFVNGSEPKATTIDKLLAYFRIELVKAKPARPITLDAKELKDAGEASKRVNEHAQRSAKEKNKSRGIHF